MTLDASRADTGAAALRRGALRIYLGAAPGVGKTYSMLAEGRRRKERGADVVVGFAETHGRERTADQLANLEVLPRRHVEVNGVLFANLDVEAVLRRRPDVCLVDELARANAPGGRRANRWEDVEDILAAGIDVVSTLDVSHLASISDVVERVTGFRQSEIIPDAVVRAADQVELVDSTPEALRRRLAHGNIFPVESVDARTANYFDTANLSALRELALLWVADQVDAEMPASFSGIDDGLVDIRERVVVAVTGAPGTEGLIRRAARIAQRARGSLVAVHVTGNRDRSGDAFEYQRVVPSLGVEFFEVAGDDVAASLVEFARAQNATQLILGRAAAEPWWRRIGGRSIVDRVVRRSGRIDVHVVSGDTRSHRGATPALPHRKSALPRGRTTAGFALAIGGVPTLTLALAQLRGHAGLPTVLLLYLTLVVGTSTVGGTAPAVLAATASFLAANWYFTPPFHRLTIAETDHVVALLAFLGVALVVSRFVDTAARRGIEASRARSEAQTLASLAASVGDGDPLPALLDHLCSVFGFTGAALMSAARGDWEILAASGEPIDAPGIDDLRRELADHTLLVARGGRLTADDHRVFNAFAARLAATLEHLLLTAEAGRARALAEANVLRSALLQAVSHDLRTPLASIKASATSLTQDDVEWSDDETREFLATITDETDRLTALVGNLLDMSRIQAGAVQPLLADVYVDEIVPTALLSLPSAQGCVEDHVPDGLPPVRGDAVLLERALANVVQNALRFSPPGVPVRIDATSTKGEVVLRVVDRGPGIPVEDRSVVVQPFQRLHDNRSSTGVGLGLAVASGFMIAMDGSLTLDDTPGGGTTVELRLPCAT